MICSPKNGSKNSPRNIPILEGKCSLLYPSNWLHGTRKHFQQVTHFFSVVPQFLFSFVFRLVSAHLDRFMSYREDYNFSQNVFYFIAFCIEFQQEFVILVICTNLLAFYHECCSLIGYATIYLNNCFCRGTFGCQYKSTSVLSQMPFSD